MLSVAEPGDACASITLAMKSSISFYAQQTKEL
jgi:hypothetical protein